MKLLIFSPAAADSTRGNRITAVRWAKMLDQLGHVVTVVDPVEFESVDISDFDGLIALHARHASAAIKTFTRLSPRGRIFVVLTGTDLHGDLPSQTDRSATVITSLEMADRIILLEPEGRKLLRPDFQAKATVIYQSATPVDHPPAKNESEFVVTVIGHLRPVKDPFLTAEATRLLPVNSRVKVIHFGQALTEDMRVRAEHETAENSRYEWCGLVSHEQAQMQLCGSQLTVLSSKFEGAPSVISEAVVNGVPILATRIAASIGLLGESYPGLFPVGDARKLAELLTRAETEIEFYGQLKSAIDELKPRFDPQAEKHTWKRLLKI